MFVRKFEEKKHRENDNETKNLIAQVWLLSNGLCLTVDIVMSHG